MILGRQPVLIMAVISGGINLALTFGLKLTAEQVSLINVLVVAVIGLIVGSNVTPTNFPKLAEGTKVEVITPGTDPNPTRTL